MLFMVCHREPILDMINCKPSLSLNNLIFITFLNVFSGRSIGLPVTPRDVKWFSNLSFFFSLDSFLVVYELVWGFYECNSLRVSARRIQLSWRTDWSSTRQQQDGRKNIWATCVAENFPSFSCKITDYSSLLSIAMDTIR